MCANEKKLCLKIINMVAESKNNKIMLFNEMFSKFYRDHPTFCRGKRLNLSDIFSINLNRLISNDRPEFYCINCGRKELGKTVLMIMTKTEEPQSDVNKSSKISGCSDLALWEESLLGDCIKTINDENFDIKLVKRHLLFQSPKRCVDYVEDVYLNLERLTDKQKHIDKLNEDGKHYGIKISFDDYREVEVGGRSMKVTEFKHHWDVKKITDVWGMMKFIRDMNQHGHEKKYPERREWLGFSDEGCDYEKFLKNVLENCPGLLTFLFKKYGWPNPEKPKNVDVYENNNIINRFE